MKKDEIVVLSNEIEIVNGVEVDWSRYRGKDNNRARKSYIGLCELLYKNRHILESDYIDATTKVSINFNCGHKPHKITPYNYKRDIGCPICNFEKIAELKKYKSKEKLYKLADERNHKILGEYKGNDTKILIDFNCGHKPHKIIPNAYKLGVGCPICNSSKGEKEVARVLKEMNIKYEEQYKFEDCRHINPLPFDFYIHKFNICIEYDGRFHYEPVRFKKENETEYDIALAQKIAEEKLKETQRRDKIKTDYCRNNGINIIRIPHWEFDNIEKILKKELSKYIQAVA